jgi:Ca2+-binding RTX toxin-like protein
MVAKSGGSCVMDSTNTWHLEMPGGSGNVLVKGWTGVFPYHAHCGADWTGPYECVWGPRVSTIRRRADGLPASAHACTIVGTAGDDTLRGTSGDDVICGRGGDDRIDGRGGDDILRGGPGADRLAGGSGDDSLDGGPGPDVIVRDGHDAYDRARGDEDTTKLVGDHRETGTLWFQDMEGREVKTSQGQPTNCTKDEQYDSFTPGDSNDFHTYGATIKSDGWCAVQPSHNAWQLTMPGGTGKVEMNDKGWDAPYQMRCLKDGWSGYTCTETYQGSGRYKVVIKPA